MKTCEIEGCDSKGRIVSGLCWKHYLRKKRHGDPMAGRSFCGDGWKFINGLFDSPVDECIKWPFATDANGYARIRSDGENKPVCPIVCERANGPNDGMRIQATHSCGRGNEGCVNPRHLVWGTGFKNQQDRIGHGTSNRGERCAASKLTEGDVIVIFSRLNAGENSTSIADEFNVNARTIRDIRQGRSWAWLTGLTNPKERDEVGNLINVAVIDG